MGASVSSFPPSCFPCPVWSVAYAGGVLPEVRRARFEVLAPQIVEPVRRYLARRTDAATADDVLSETLLVCWRRLEDVPKDNPLPWVYRTAANCLANAQRSARRQQRVAGKIAVLDPPREAPEPVGDLDLSEAMAQLNSDEVDVIRLWAWEQLSAAEMATVLGVSPNAATLRFHRAKLKLATILKDQARERKDGPPAGHEQVEGGEG